MTRERPPLLCSTKALPCPQGLKVSGLAFRPTVWTQTSLQKPFANFTNQQDWVSRRQSEAVSGCFCKDMDCKLDLHILIVIPGLPSSFLLNNPLGESLTSCLDQGTPYNFRLYSQEHPQASLEGGGQRGRIGAWSYLSPTPSRKPHELCTLKTHKCHGRNQV